ncbi:MAG: CHAT domain-containing protein [Methylococcales bacterium]|nr:CHAT domain-containing protein [Methylococcales bacterium]
MEKFLPVLTLAFLTLSMSPAMATPPGLPNGNHSSQVSGLARQLALGEAYRDSGSYELAATEFKGVLAEATAKGDALTQAMAAAALGYNYYLDSKNVKAEDSLGQALRLAAPLKSPGLSALIEDYLGMLYLSMQMPEKAAAKFDNALKNAQIAKNKELIADIHVNQLGLELDANERLKQLENSRIEVLGLNDGPFKINLMLNLGEQLLALDPEDLEGAQIQQQLNSTYQTLNNAYLLADSTGQVRLRSQAEGNLAKLYVQQKRNKDALLWLDKAIADAQQTNATDLSLQWETQSASLLHAENNHDGSLKAYQRAAKHLADIRYGLPVTLHNGTSSIKGIIEPVYRGMADVLLSQADKETSNEAKQGLLKAAVEAMETIKKTELEDYFKDRCIVDEDVSSHLMDEQLPGVGIIYPIILPDRLVVVLRAGEDSHLVQKSVPVPADEVVDTTSSMALLLRHGENYRKASHKLYDWLFRAYDDDLKARGISNLIYVPDGILRQVPFSALLNGNRFVVEDYTLVTLPGLTLKKTAPNADQKPRALIAALSKPDGASVTELMQGFDFGNSGRGLIDSNGSSSSKVSDMGRSELVERLSLPGVDDEVLSLQKNIDNTTLKNKAFTYDEFKGQVKSGEYSNIHIASHGYFGKSAEDSFVMTYDRNLKLVDFQALLGSDAIKKKPIDLLTLSACETAEGDDRALLGFSGIAVKTNARSAVGTLWSVDDTATAKFMEAFYGNLAKFPKAQALRQAQLALLRDPKLKHPHYWSPFILVGNW